MFILAGTMTALAEVSEPAGTLNEQAAEVEVSDTNLNGTFLPVCPYPWPPCPYPWPPCPVMVTVTFDMHGHGAPVAPQAWWSWVYVTEPDEPSEEGWIFDGWYADKEYTEEFEFNRWVCKDTKVHAKWTEIPAPVTEYTVSFEMNGHGTAPADQKVNAGEKATKPSDPTADGYTFEGWFAEEGLTTPFDFNTPITGNTTIYAKWTEIPAPVTEYTVSFEMNGHGTAPADQKVNAGEKATKPSDPTADGYTFEGWFAEEVLTTPFDFDTPITAPTIIYAKWTANVDPPKPTPTDPSYPTYPVNPTSSPISGNGPAFTMPETSPVETVAETQLDVVPETGRNVPVILGTVAMLSALLYAGTRKAEDGLRRKKRKH